MEHAFGECNRVEGGGLEAHPRLTTDIQYRASDNATTMKEARMISLAPRGFSISLSSVIIIQRTIGFQFATSSFCYYSYFFCFPCCNNSSSELILLLRSFLTV